MLENWIKNCQIWGMTSLKLQVQPQPRKTRHDQGLNHGKSIFWFPQGWWCRSWTRQVLRYWLFGWTLVESCSGSVVISCAHWWDRKKRLRPIAWWPRETIEENSGTPTEETSGVTSIGRNRVTWCAWPYEIREILGILWSQRLENQRQYAIMKCWKEIEKWNKNDFHWCQMTRSALTESQSWTCTMSLIWSVISRVSIEIKLFRMGLIAEETPVKPIEKQVEKLKRLLRASEERAMEGSAWRSACGFERNACKLSD